MYLLIETWITITTLNLELKRTMKKIHTKTKSRALEEKAETLNLRVWTKNSQKVTIILRIRITMISSLKRMIKGKLSKGEKGLTQISKLRIEITIKFQILIKWIVRGI